MSDSFPYSASIIIRPPGVPGVTAASGPYSGGYAMPRSWKNSGVAPVGATPSALTAMTLPVFGLKISACVSPPHESVSNIVVVAASIAHAASTALPPFWKIIEPAVAAERLAGDRDPVLAVEDRLVGGAERRHEGEQRGKGFPQMPFHVGNDTAIAPRSL